MYQRRRHWIGGLLCVAAALAPASAWAAEGGLINIDWRSLSVQMLNFIVLLVILTKLLYRPFLAKMEERTAAIRSALEQAQAARSEAARQQEENEARLRAAHAEAAAIREQALKEASDEQRRLLEAARAESQRMVDGAKAQLEADARRAREELRREVGELATTVAEKLIRRSLRDEDHRRIVADAISKVGN